MPTTFLTGRSRTLTFAGTFTGSAGAMPVQATDASGNPLNTLAYRQIWRTTIAVGFAGWTLQALTYVFDASGNPWNFPRESGAFQYGFAQLNVLNPAGAVVQTVQTQVNNGGWQAPIGFDFGTASWSASLPVEEVCTVGGLAEVDPASVTTLDGSDFPPFNGLPAQPDGPPANYVTFTEQPTGDLVLTLTAAGMSLSQTVSHVGLNWSYAVSREVFIATQNQATTASLSATMIGLPLVGDLTYSTIFSLDEAGGQTVNVPYRADPSSHGYQLQSTTQVPVEYDLNARLRSFADPFAGGGTFVWLAKAGQYQSLPGPSATGVSQQRAWQATAQIDNLPVASTQAQELTWVRVYVQNSSSSPSIDDPRDWRCAIRGKPFRSFTLAQDAATEVFSGGGFSTTTDVNPMVTNWEGYRYLQFTADQAGSITVGTKTYAWTAPGTVLLDLCSPTHWSVGPLPAVDARTGRWPLVDPSTGPTGTPDETTVPDSQKGVYWGIFSAPTFTVTPVSTPLNLGPMSLGRQRNAFLSALPKFLPDFYGWRDGAGTTYDLGPFFTLASDGKQVADWPAALHVLPASGSPSFQFFTLTDLIGFVNSTPGWHATPSSSFPADGYHNNNLLAFTAFGSGAVWRNGSWSEGVDAPIPQTVFAQTLYDQVQGYPAIGNAWESSDYAGPPGLPVAVTKHWRGAAWRLAFNTDGSPLAGAQVVTTNPANCGTGTVDLGGAYQTGSPYGPAPLDTTTTLVSATNPSDHKPWANRWRVRDSFRATLAAERQPWNLVTPWGDYHRASISASGNVVYRSAPLAGERWAVQTTVTSDGDWSWPRMVRDPLSRLELRAIQHGQGAWAFLSDDEGQTWSTPVSIQMSATLSDIRCSPDGTLLETCFVPDSGTSGPGTFSMRLRRLGDLAWSAPFIPNDNAGSSLRSDGSGFAIDHALEGPDRWILTMVTAGETIASDWWSADDGATWKRF